MQTEGGKDGGEKGTEEKRRGGEMWGWRVWGGRERGVEEGRGGVGTEEKKRGGEMWGWRKGGEKPVG
jgi:hypothetical protein